MSDTPATEPIRIRKYPNRRFYDVTHSRHVTLADLHRFVRDGRVISVTDSKTGEDITPLVLTQIILEHDPPKMALFSSDLLHQVIQANQQIIRLFMDNYFGRLFESFVRSQSQFQEALRRSGIPGFGAFQTGDPMAWTRAWFGQQRSDEAAQHDVPSNNDAEREGLRQTVTDLRHQVDDLRNQLDTMNEKKRTGRSPKSPRRRPR
jgi:polyhydroxyalkanoate synthesis repressor PhaR